ncbi:hypothetical protein [Mesorhizobium tamadayense]|uniref:hypothetical protein n=1 Tax=Mesorhizobium tamadayense TaxID=425306 RepID=UPI00142E4E0C|nr:hypothetical protein [Mesorhizobium tamadayense]
MIMLVVGFILWDRFDNDGAYTADVERSFREASLEMPGGWKLPTITFNRDPLKQ